MREPVVTSLPKADCHDWLQRVGSNRSTQNPDRPLLARSDRSTVSRSDL